MPECTIASWDELARFVQDHADGEWLFRGVTDALNHDLIPKIARKSLLKGEGSPDTRSYDVAEEVYYYETFKRQARPYVLPTPASELEWMAVAQHHGFPTRLLDWTWSPLFAAYFATEPSGILGGEYVPAAIYAIRGFERIRPGDDSRTGHNPFMFKHVRVYDPPHISPRIPAQRAAFTVHNRPDEPLEADSSKGEVIEKWTIPSRACFEIKRVLDVCASNRASLFPDLDGLARHVEWRYKWRVGYVPDGG